MPFDIKNYLVIAVSSRALFNLETENKIFDEDGLDAYREYQNANREKILEPGVAFPLVKKILKINEIPEIPRKAEVIILSRNNLDCYRRIANSLDHFGIGIARSAWTSGTPLCQYLKPFEVDLFLSANEGDVRSAINEGFAAARIYTSTPVEDSDSDNTLRIAFDGDAVLFSDESEKIYKEQGLEKFLEYERKNARKPLPDGPFAKLLRSLVIIQKALPTDNNPIRTALITARNSPAHDRVISTLEAWDVRIDEAFFLGGIEKKEFIKAFNPDFFFDDQDVHCTPSSQIVPTGRVYYRE